MLAVQTQDLIPSTHLKKLTEILKSQGMLMVWGQSQHCAREGGILSVAWPTTDQPRFPILKK